MEKVCFVIMPKGSPAGYANGHFNRVFQYIIGPACRFSGFTTLRADGPSSDEPLDMLKTIIDSEMVICDLSGSNSHALYAFAIREALKLPVILVRDTKSKGVDISEFEYDESLRIDTVEQEVETLGKALNEAFAGKTENSTLGRLGIGAAAKKAEAPALSEPVAEPEAPKKPSLPLYSPVPDNVGGIITQEEIDALKVGDSVFHIYYGKGEIKSIRKDKLSSIQFGSESKMLVIVPSGTYKKIV